MTNRPKASLTKGLLGFIFKFLGQIILAIPGIRVLMVGVVTFSSMCHVMVLICILLLLVKITEEKQIDQNF